MQSLPNHLCPLCGGANQCSPAQAGRLDVECWCTMAPVSKEALARVPVHLLNKACLCPRCAAGLPPSKSASED
nr:cysteine-rich CWC family protein [Pseudomonas linyingensis]